MLLFAFFWGATVAALVAAVLNTASLIAIARTGGGSGMDTTAVLVAPWVEEAAKGAAVLLVLLFRRNEFDGVVDGIVLAGLSAVGFAFTENVLYFGRAFLAGQEQSLTTGFFAAGLTFVLRGVFSPFAHPLFTAMTGIGLGIAARTPNPATRLLAPLGGYLLAVLLHGAWNLSSLSGLSGFFTGYILIMVPVFALTIALATWSRRREGATVAARLPTYVDAGWLDPQDVPMLASLQKRRQALDWMEARYGGGKAQALRDFQHSATELAFLRDRVERGLDVPDFPARERELLDGGVPGASSDPADLTGSEVPMSAPLTLSAASAAGSAVSAVRPDQLVEPRVAVQRAVQVEQVVVGEGRPGGRRLGVLDGGGREAQVGHAAHRQDGDSGRVELDGDGRLAGQAGEQRLTGGGRALVDPHQQAARGERVLGVTLGADQRVPGHGVLLLVDPLCSRRLANHLRRTCSGRNAWSWGSVRAQLGIISARAEDEGQPDRKLPLLPTRTTGAATS